MWGYFKFWPPSKLGSLILLRTVGSRFHIPEPNPSVLLVKMRELPNTGYFILEADYKFIYIYIIIKKWKKKYFFQIEKILIFFEFFCHQFLENS
jgi:hypothetical protein